jgi:phosphate transport system permease protein
MTLSWRRQLSNAIAVGLIGLAALLVLLPLVAVFGTVVVKGLGGLSWTFLTHMPKPVGETGGGMANAIAGSAMILLGASCIGVPLGVGAGVFLAEHGRNGFGNVIRFTADVLNGVPSIVIGMTAYVLVVLTQHHFSMVSGSIALGVMMVPTISRATEEVLLMVPQSIREGALGLGIPYWRVILSVTVPTARSGIITGIMLAFARVAGETAPLMFTAFGNAFWNTRINQPTAALPLQIFQFAISAYDDWHQQAWTGALVLIILIVGTIAFVRLVASRGMMKGAN